MGNGKEDELKRLAQAAAERQGVITAQQEKVRKQLEGYTNAAVAKYDAQCKQYETLGKNLLTSVVIPWWQEFQSSELFAQLRGALAGKSWFRLNVSDPIQYFWPTDALSDLREQQGHRGKACDILTWVIVDDYKRNGRDIAENIRERGTAYTEETWHATAHVESFGDGENLYFSRWPEQGAGWAFAMTSRSYDVPISASIDTGRPRGIHPLVLIEFAGQIQSGHAWDVLEASFQRNLREE
ncbi:MAG: hypothetical protein UY16_C0065G0010 [Candidatus Gottesmanbacteria bacterium GW2011_GWA2_47_9]|uniref:Uncharacterized protein n=1 Tax=Candidatus Gottesmanbacteria bacterium GW2011_GWA2_47_9 TaxID=1618445 RepID=A0A0G1TVT2_9BACT|nr:MAG: hypothetical protein UY16_C0065G0010 [Candidatus Gottesmanbacteria bacterium GW2011_GWA2_47_9]